MDDTTHAPSHEPERPRRGGYGARLLMGVGCGALLAVVAAGIGVGVLLGRSGDADEPSAKRGYLEVALGGQLADAPGDVGFVMDPADFPPLVTEVSARIRQAAGDEDITGLYLEVGGSSLGWAATQEIRDAIAAFSASGKPCHVWAQELDNKGYALASACANIHLAPAGLVLVNGLSLTNEYYAGTLEKVGVKANFEHVGDFKSAVEPFQRSGPSDAASEATNALLDSLYSQLVEGIAGGRKVDAAKVQSWIDAPAITPQAAVEAGLVDDLKYRDEVREGIAGEERVKLSAYALDEVDADAKTVAIVHAEGQIISGRSDTSMFGGSFVGDESFVKMIDEVREDEDVVAVVLRVNSPGGSGLASDNMWHALERLKAAGKPLVVSMGDYAASGGYYIAAPADYIVAQPGTLTGSIGVFGGKMNIAGLYDKVGVTLHTWQRGQLAGLLSATTDFNDAERASFRSFLEGFYGTFLDRVSDGRKMDRDAVHQVAQGRVWTGVQAKERGLVDELGGLDVAIAKARALAKVADGVDVKLERYPARRTFLDKLVEDLGNGESLESQAATLPPELALPAVRETWATVDGLSRVLGDGGAVVMLPGTLRVD